jgi:hypothetical protein
MSDFITRLYDEKTQLEDKTNKLGAFLFTVDFIKLDEIQQGLLQIQHSAMMTYLKCLNERIVRLSPKSSN